MRSISSQTGLPSRFNHHESRKAVIIASICMLGKLIIKIVPAILICLATFCFVSPTIVAFVSSQDADPSGVILQGIVFEDLNRNSVRDPNESLISGVSVSDQIDVAVTDNQGA